MDKRLRISSPEKTIVKTNMKYDMRQLKRIQVIVDRKRLPPPSETMQVIHTVDKPEEIKIHLEEGEGSRPIFDRSDIIVNKEETEHRTVSTYSPHKSPGRSQNNSHKSSFGSDSPRRVRDRESPRRTSRYSESPTREHKSSKSNRRSSSLHRQSSRPSTSSRNRSRSRDDGRRSRRSRSRSRGSRREFGRRRNSRSPVERDRRRYERRTYGPNERDSDRRRNRSRSPRYARRSPRRRSRSRPPHMTPIDPTTVIPLYLPPFYGAEEAVWFPPPLRPPMLMPPGIPMHPRGMYRGPIPGMRPPMPGRPPFMPPRQAPFRQIRPQNRPQLQ